MLFVAQSYVQYFAAVAVELLVGFWGEKLIKPHPKRNRAEKRRAIIRGDLPMINPHFFPVSVYFCLKTDVPAICQITYR